MLIFLRHKIAFLATPKTGTTAVEMALKPKAEIIFAKGRKHVTAVRYRRKIAPFLNDTFGVRPESVAVMRNPVDQIRSWYRYRSGARLAGSELSTQNISFDTYVREVIVNDAPPRAQIGSQLNFLTDGEGALMADHLFSYDHQTAFLGFLSERLEDAIILKARNVSPPGDAPISNDTLALLREARKNEFDLFDRLIANGGYLTGA